MCLFCDVDSSLARLPRNHDDFEKARRRSIGLDSEVLLEVTTAELVRGLNNCNSLRLKNIIFD